MATATFFRIHKDLAWARQYWDTYGFDFDTQSERNGTFLAWADGISSDELQLSLTEAGVRYTCFEADPEQLIG